MATSLIFSETLLSTIIVRNPAWNILPKRVISVPLTRVTSSNYFSSLILIFFPCWMNLLDSTAILHGVIMRTNEVMCMKCSYSSLDPYSYYLFSSLSSQGTSLLSILPFYSWVVLNYILFMLLLYIILFYLLWVCDDLFLPFYKIRSTEISSTGKILRYLKCTSWWFVTIFW